MLSEDDDVKPMIASWIAQQPPECQGSLATWFDSTFHRALDWIYKGPGGGQLTTKHNSWHGAERPGTHGAWAEGGHWRRRKVRYCNDVQGLCWQSPS